MREEHTNERTDRLTKFQFLPEDARKEAANILYKKVEYTEKLMFWLTLCFGILALFTAELLLLSSICASDASSDYDVSS